MWYLTSETDQRTLYVVPSKEVTIGRSVDSQVCNFAIPDDPSISRKHAILSVSDGCLYVQDQGSRYGTFINDFTEKLDGTKRQLSSDDSVRFGKMTSIWRVHEVSFVTCSSTLKGENLQNLKVCLEKLGGVFRNEWDDSCVYLTMPAITLTIKVVLALAQGSHIVTTDFWTKCVEAVNKQSLLPDPRLFTPQVVESTLNKESVSFHPLEERKQLFAGKTIVFFSRRQLDMYRAVLLRCSSTPLLLSETKMNRSALAEPNVIVIQYNISNSGAETQAQKTQIAEILNYLKIKGKRLVADAEIGLAILYCSTSKYCNPDFNFTSEVIKQAPPAAAIANVLVKESQDPTQKSQQGNVIINESLNTPKRKLSEENGNTESNPNKKFATEQPVSTVNESVKRKRDDSNDLTNANKKVAVEGNENGLFDFLNNSVEENNFQEKKLNLKKPVQKKSGANDEEELFNFVEDESKPREDSRNNIFEAAEIKKEPVDKKADNVDVSALRGTKLKELENATYDAPNVKRVKLEKDDPEGLDTKMTELDLGTTILTIKKELIIKKEPLEIVAQDYSQRNFKKFKKIWPIHMHVTVVPRTTMTIEIPDDDETPAAACGTTPDGTKPPEDITDSTDVNTDPSGAKEPTDILKVLAEQHNIMDAEDITGTTGVSHEPIDEFMSQAY